MALSEIEKLERRYADNPQGLTFAPLAEIHRKNGEVQRALDLLGPGLEIHPDYIPANIVLGRCRMDLGDVQAAESAFMHVLALDGENAIALKALADISERMLKFGDAERWLNALLTVDRSNDDAREQLQRVEISRRQSEVASSAEPSSVLDPATVGEASGSVDSGSEASPMGVEGLDTSTRPEQLGSASESLVEEHPPLGIDEPAGLQLDAPSLLDDDEIDRSVEPLDGLVGRDLNSPDEDPVGDFRVETSEEIVLESAGGGEFQMPDASQEFFAVDGQGTRAPLEDGAALGRSSDWETPRAEPVAAGVGHESEGDATEGPRSELLDEPQPEPGEPRPEEHSTPEFVTAELVAHEFLESETATPEPPAPEPAAFEPISPEPLPAASAPGDFRDARRPEAAQSAAAPPRRSVSARETGGRSVAQLLQGILSARPPAQAPAPPVRQVPAAGSAGAPTRPAADALSLNSVFGEESAETPPAVPASSQAGSVSFDDFFSPPSGAPASRTPRAPDSKTDDLDQFHAWLQNLKR